MADYGAQGRQKGGLKAKRPEIRVFSLRDESEVEQCGGLRYLLTVRPSDCPCNKSSPGLVLAAAPFVPALLKVAHERVPALAGFGALRLADRSPSQGCKVNTGPHDNEAQHTKEDVL